MELKDKDDWVKINAGQHTLMRVLYTPEMMKRLERGVRDRTLASEVKKKKLDERRGSFSFCFLVCRAHVHKRFSEHFFLARKEAVNVLEENVCFRPSRKQKITK